ncbi:MAG: MFS transporter [Myxococcales bacterium]|nr:MFS transporter [Myxococcales bacterium]
MQRTYNREFVLAFFGYFLAGLAFGGYLHLPGLLRDFGANDTRMGIIAAVPPALSVLLRPWIGQLSDRVGRRPVLRAGSAIALAACALYVVVDDMGPLLYFVRILHGVAQAILFAVYFTVASDHVPAARRTQGLAIFGIAGMLPLALSGALGDWIVPHFGYRALFIALAVLEFGSFILTLFLKESAPAEARGRRPVLGMLTRPELVPLWIAIFGFEVAAATYFTFIKTFTLDTHLGSVGEFFGFYSGAAIVLRVFFGWIPDRLGPRRTLVPALGASMLGYAVLANATTEIDVIVAGLLTGTGHGFVYPIVASLVVSRVADVERGASLALYTAVYEAGLLVGSPIIGAVLEHYGYDDMFWLAFSVVATAAILFSALDHRRPALLRAGP